MIQGTADRGESYLSVWENGQIVSKPSQWYLYSEYKWDDTCGGQVDSQGCIVEETATLTSTLRMFIIYANYSDVAYYQPDDKYIILIENSYVDFNGEKSLNLKPHLQNGLSATMACLSISLLQNGPRITIHIKIGQEDMTIRLPTTLPIIQQKILQITPLRQVFSTLKNQQKLKKPLSRPQMQIQKQKLALPYPKHLLPQTQEMKLNTLHHQRHLWLLISTNIGKMVLMESSMPTNPASSSRQSTWTLQIMSMQMILSSGYMLTRNSTRILGLLTIGIIPTQIEVLASSLTLPAINGIMLFGRQAQTIASQILLLLLAQASRSLTILRSIKTTPTTMWINQARDNTSMMQPKEARSPTSKTNRLWNPAPSSQIHTKPSARVAIRFLSLVTLASLTQFTQMVADSQLFKQLLKLRPSQSRWRLFHLSQMELLRQLHTLQSYSLHLYWLSSQ
ncbi:hypothetical protein FGO68_gene4937 [Halteria grandinella]|uniref:Uncharacterized protein n=1 Tax=Halteria grandinella TaxID=5974 RepID=A0A8J8T788_HALGN|nr:hypothetical protein FGO68_gene4937 [Halteria grandinella]